MKVQGPNGLIFTVSEPLGQALLVNEGFRQVSDPPKVQTKPKK